jgi:Protein of unknown function (DUF1071)
MAIPISSTVTEGRLTDAQPCSEHILYVPPSPLDTFKSYISIGDVIPPDIYLENYNLPIDDYVERHTAKETAQKGSSKQILYMSYSHAFLRTRHPELEVACAINPYTNSPVFKEIDDLGYFIYSFVYNKKTNGRSAYYYNAVLTMSGQGIYPGDIQLDYKTGQPKLDSRKRPLQVLNSQVINKAVRRAEVKAIALATGIGLKLWTGDDLSEEVLDAKMELISKVQSLFNDLQAASVECTMAELTYMSSTAEIMAEGKRLKGFLPKKESKE